MLLVTGWIQPAVDSSLSDRFLQEKFGHLVEDVSGGTLSVLLAMPRHPGATAGDCVPTGATLGFLPVLSLPLLLIPLLSVIQPCWWRPLLIALVSRALGTVRHLRYVLALVPGLYLGSVLWCAILALVEAVDLSLLGGCPGTCPRSPWWQSPSGSALVPDSFSPGFMSRRSEARTPRRPA